MKKILIAAAGALLIGGASAHHATAHADTNDTTAVILSLLFSGAGEWYNAGFQGGFPVVECIMGKVCPCVGISSIIDAAAGKTDDGMRFDFWSSPN